MKLLSWCDTSRIAVNVTDGGRNFVADVMRDSVDGKAFLETKIRATHSGHLIQGRCYSGWGMRSGCPSWFSQDDGGKSAFNKPILRNHDLMGTPMGRVVYADFTQLKTGEEWVTDWQSPDSGSERFGSGYITTTGHIYEPQAIEEIMDGRLDSVSTRQNAHDAWCSIDGVNFRQGCDHKIGKFYEDEEGDLSLCYAVTGLLDYVELSFVASPRQPNARTLSFHMMRDALADTTDDGNLLVADCFLDFTQDMEVYMRSNQVVINLADDDLPSTSVLTGKTQVSMAGKKIQGTKPSVVLSDLESAMAKADTPVEEVDGDSTPSDSSVDVKFAYMARLWKDHLDLETDFKDSHYIVGITDKADRHAHSFEGFLDSKNKILTGRTWGTGQGKTDHGHSHPIWVEDIDMNLTDVKGGTRDADAGNSHVHTFSASMIDGETACGTLIANVESIQGAVSYLDQRENKDTLDSSEVEEALKDDAKTAWDESYRKAALPLLGRLDLKKRQEVIADMFSPGLLQDQTNSKEDDMPSATVERLLKSLMDEKETLQGQLVAATQLADSKESERQTLLSETKELKVTNLRLKARLIVDAQDRLSEEELTDEARTAKIEEFASKDEAELDQLLDSEVIEKIAPQPEEPASADSDNDPDDVSTADLVADASEPVVSDRDRKEFNDNAQDEIPGKSLAGLNARATKVYARS